MPCCMKVVRSGISPKRRWTIAAHLVHWIRKPLALDGALRAACSKHSLASVDWSENLSAGSLIRVSQPGHTGYSANNFATTNSEVSPVLIHHVVELLFDARQAMSL
jgi:hypothetical protein